ncbi:MAG: argininosuccinate lyase [Candidatus Brocadiaceae bacterium]|jgi:argininosuccinate lyase
MKKPWGGRFEKDTDELAEQFTQSVSFDRRLYREDIRASIAHAEMLARCQLLTETELVEIREALKEIERKIEEGTFEFSVPLEDIHMNIEAALIRRIGDAGRKLHTARSRNDQVACDVRLWVRGAIDGSCELLADCQRALLEKAEDCGETVLPGYTHLQHAQPVLLGHVLLAYVEMLQRDVDRLQDGRRRTNVSPLGACALAGTGLPIDPQSTAQALEFERCFSNSVDAVSDRDFVLEFVFDLSLVAMHLSRLAEDWIIWSSQEFDFVDLDESFCTGSSIMPQKKNPDLLELVRGRCGRVYGDLTALLTVFKGLPLAYNRDMQEDKEALFDASDTVQGMLQVMAQLIRTTEFKEDSIARACEEGHMEATALADYLVGRGVPFREAHEAAGHIVQAAAADGVRIEDLSIEQLRSFSEVIGEDLYKVLGVRSCIESYCSHGSSAPEELQRQLEHWREKLSPAPEAT